MSWRPTLRPDLVRLPAEAAALAGAPPDVDDLAAPAAPAATPFGALRDPVLNRRVNLGPASAALVPLLDGAHPLEEVLAATDRAAAERALRSLLLMNLVEGAGDAIVSRARAVQAGEVGCDPVVLPGTRFGCQGSGDCCKSYVFGPLRDEDVARLEALPIEARYPYLGPGPYVQLRPLRDGSERPFLRTFGQQCVFQLPDERCGLHAAFGEEAKPALCRLYPYQQVPTIYGRKIYDRSECATFALSAAAGPPVTEELPRLLELLQEPGELCHPLLQLPGGVPCDYGHFHPLEEALCRALDQGDGGPAVRLGRCAAWLRTFVRRITSCPLAPGEPERTVAGIVAAPPELEPGESAPGLRALSSLCAALREELLPHRLVIERARSQRRALQQLLDLDEALLALAALAAHGAGGPAPPERLRGLLDVAPDPLSRGAIDGALRLSLRSQLFSDRAFVDDRPVAGLLRALLIQLVALTRARLLAAGRGAAHFTVADFNAGHALAVRLLNQEIVIHVFVAHEERTWDAAAAAPALLAWPLGAAPATP